MARSKRLTVMVNVGTSVVKFGMAVFVLSDFQCGVRDLHSSWMVCSLDS